MTLRKETLWRLSYARQRLNKAVASLPALGPGHYPAEHGPSLESIYRVSLKVDLCKANKIISFY